MKQVHRRLAVAVIAASFSIPLLAGCSGDDDSPTSEENVTAACTALSELKSTLDSASSDMKTATTVGELRTIRESIVAAYDKADAAVEDVADDQANALTDAWTTFTKNASAVGDDASLAQARDTMVAEAQSFARTRDEVQAELSCQ
ncbi:hypothetical protein [Gordonia malaquae]|uniref:hypothetical protein n=1 Tax=Gordonia malaquae TaxID=410332 RepID=UPI003017806F